MIDLPENIKAAMAEGIEKKCADTLNHQFSQGKSRHHLIELFKDMGLREGVEIGVNTGDHARVILDKWPGFLHLVDWWPYEANYQRALELVGPHMDRTKWYRKLSVEAAKEFADESMDFVYIDATHTYDAVKEDLAAWAPKVRMGGLVSGHDFCLRETLPDGKEQYGVALAILEHLEGEFFRLRVAHDEGEWGTWFYVKP